MSPERRSDGKRSGGKRGSRPPEGEKGVPPNPPDPARTLGDHDPELLARRGMSDEAAEVDDAETMASTGDASNSFQEIASGSATGLGIDRAESTGTGGLAAGEDDDEVAEGDWWRQGLEDRPAPGDRSAERYELDGRRLGWEAGGDLDRRRAGLDDELPANPSEDGERDDDE